MSLEDIRAELWGMRQDAFIETSRALDDGDAIAAEYWTGKSVALDDALNLIDSLED